MVGVPRLILFKNAKGEIITSYMDGSMEPHDAGPAGDKALATAALKWLMAGRKEPWIRKNMKNIVGFSISQREIVSLRNKKPPKVKAAGREISREDAHFRPAVPTAALGL